MIVIFAHGAHWHRLHSNAYTVDSAHMNKNTSQVTGCENGWFEPVMSLMGRNIENPGYNDNLYMGRLSMLKPAAVVVSVLQNRFT